MEGKSATCAHFSPMGNIAAAHVGDLWSNESVQNIRLLSGSAPEAYTERLAVRLPADECRLPSGRRFRPAGIGSARPISG